MNHTCNCRTSKRTIEEKCQIKNLIYQTKIRRNTESAMIFKGGGRGVGATVEENPVLILNQRIYILHWDNLEKGMNPAILLPVKVN